MKLHVLLDATSFSLRNGMQVVHTFKPLSWNLRMRLALGAAKGLAFLHSDKAKVIYRDFKTSNVLLDSSTMQSFLILDWQKVVQLVIKVMFLPGSWEHMDMLPLNILQQHFIDQMTWQSRSNELLAQV